MQRCMAFFIFGLLAFGTRAPAYSWETDCNAAIPVTMVDSVDSATAFPGMPFRFKLTVDANLGGHIVPQETIGYGYVREVTGASNHDRNGSLVLEPREIIYKNLHIQVIADPRETALWAPAATITDRALGYVPVPGIVRTAANELRDGKNVTIGPGFYFHVIVLDDPRNTKPCRKVGDS